MKKTLILVLGAMLMGLLPGNSVKAQSKSIELSVRTLDHTALQSAWIFAGADTADYFVDSAHLSSSYTGTAVWCDTAVASMNLTVTEDGFGVRGSVDSAMYAVAAIVVRDQSGRLYVLGRSTAADRLNGIVKVDTLFTAADTLAATLTAANNGLMDLSVLVRDQAGWGYSTLAAAVANTAADSITVLADINIASGVAIGRDVTILQNGKTITSDVALPFNITAGTVNWNGQSGTISANAASTKLFSVENASLVLKRVSATAANIVTVENGGALTVDNSTLTGDAALGNLLIAKGNALVQVDTVNFTGGNYGIFIADEAEAVVNVLASTVTSRMSSYTTPIRANAYSTASNYRAYRRTLKAASEAVGLGSIVRLARNIPAEENDTISTGMALLLEGDSIKGELHINHTAGTVVLQNGSVNVLSTDADNASDITVDSIDVLTNFLVNSHKVTLNNGRYNNIDIANATPQTLTIVGGKYNGNPRATMRQFLFPGKSFDVNTDADADRFPYMVVDGYTVKWQNWDYKNHDTFIVYNRPDHLINPVLNRNVNYSDNLGIDTIFIGWYADAAFNTPWVFTTDELVSDTTLYARYDTIDRAIESEYVVVHLRRNLANTAYDTANVLTYADSTGHDIIVYPALYYGYEATKAVDTIVNLGSNAPAVDTLTFYYNRLRFPVVWHAGVGVVDDSTSTVNHAINDTLFFGDTIDYTLHYAFREGYNFDGWQQNHVTMPYHNDTVWAQYTRNSYPVSWVKSGDTLTVTADTADYNGSAYNVLSGSYTNDFGTGIVAGLVFINGTDTVRSPNYPVNAGTWTVKATPVDTAYLLSNDNFTVVINPAPVSITGIQADTVKFYDGNRSALVTNTGSLTGLIGTDTVSYMVTALYDDAEVGEGKTIVAIFGLTGDLSQNYTLGSPRDTITLNGAILERVTPDTVNHETGIEVEATGYCSGNGAIQYYLASGSATADQYKLTFDDASFTNIPWTNRAATDNSIDITVPAGTPAGVYTATLVFRNSTYGIESAPIVITFKVNLPETYTMPLFSDVIALVDTCQCFSDIHWYHSTDGGATWTEVVEAQGKYYLQEEGGLTGEYYVSATMNGQSVFTCPQTDVTTLLADDNTSSASVSAYPNPVTDRVNILVEGSTSRHHTIRVMSVMGLTLVDGTFEGNSTTIDLSGYQTGNYVVSVDGIVVRVIKK